MAEIDEIIDQPSDSQKRITKLSNDVKTTAEERDVAKAAQAEAEAKAAESDRKAAFADGFADIVADNPAAKEFKADIQAKVMSGYTIEDATFAVLGKAGKINQPKVDTMSMAGGSAATNLPPQGVEKSIAEMTQAERRVELANRADLVDILAPRTQR